MVNPTCKICNQQLTTAPHVCNSEHIKERIKILEDRVNAAESRLVASNPLGFS